MKAVVPVAGMGTRLRPHTYTTPKALFQVAGRPILAYILDEVVHLDIGEVVLVVDLNINSELQRRHHNHQSYNARLYTCHRYIPSASDEL